MTRKPPFRAEHVGSLLRPGRCTMRAPPSMATCQAGSLRREAFLSTLRPIEDAAIREAVAMQERAGMESITDGEYRRRSWYQDFVLGLDNTAIRFEVGPLSFADYQGNRAPSPRIYIEGKLSRSGRSWWTPSPF